MIITIDGPAGSGKSTAARELAKRLNIAFLDTGATYRAVTLRAMRAGADLSDEPALCAVARDADIQLIPQDDGTRVLLDGRDVSADIRTPEVTEDSRYAATFPTVRDVLVQLQRKIGRSLGSFVAEGRDQGSVVFPDADVKFYMDASPDVRAERRTAELAAAGQDVSFDEVRREIIARDERDRTRAVAPLVKPAGAIVVDTDNRTIAEVSDILLRHVEAVR